MIDTAIFDEYPKLRDMIGNFGHPVLHIRPINRTVFPWTKENSNDVPVRGWIIYDHEGCKRDLVPVKLVSNKLKWDGRSIELSLHPCLCGFPKGVVLDVPLMGQLVVPFDQDHGPTTSNNTLTATYVLHFYDGKQLYTPTEDFD